jgi:hypothetical protein
MSGPGFFTGGITFELPHPSINQRLVLIVHAVVERGLELLRTDPPEGFDLRTAKEDVITFQLQWVIENRLRRNNEVRGFNRRNFGRVWREPKVTNFDGGHPDKMPDLVFDLNRDLLPILGSHDGLFVECKPVDDTHAAGEHYCDKGLRRFVNGDYAWTMQEAMMVAYVRDGRSVGKSLLSAVVPRRKALKVVVDPAPVDRSPVNRVAEILYASTHARGFPWPDGRGCACDIRIFHSWHSCS